MNALTGIAIYDPRRLSEADFLAGFIARTTLVDHLLAQLSRTVETGEAKHRLIIGTRGMGKTSLLRRLAIGIGTDPVLGKALLPLTFREEQYNVRNLAQFWRNCGEALAEWFESAGDQSQADHLDRALRKEAWATPDGAADAFLGAIAKLGRRAVLLIDNLDLILDALPEAEHWQLRRSLQARSGPIVIGASTRALRQAGDHDAAFYEFFRDERLEALTEAELLTCVARLAEGRGEAGKPVMDVLRRQPERLRVLHTMTGGNPRILTLLYQLLERAESDTVYGDLEILLDQMTPLYKARVEELGTELQRAMLDAIALHWDPITAHDLSAATSVPVTTVSSQLSRLQDFGYVESVPTSGSRSGYQVVERFFNIWYLMRHGTRRTRQKMRWLTAWLTSFYTDDELVQMRGRAANAPHSRWRPLLTEALDVAIEWRGRPKAADAFDVLGQSPADGDETALADYVRCLNFARRFVGDRDFRSAEQSYREAIVCAPASPYAWDDLGDLLQDHLGRYDDAEQAYREAIARDPEFPNPWTGLGNLLQNHLGRYDEAEQAYREAIARDPEFLYAWTGLGHLLENHLGRYDEAEQAYREAIARDPEFSYAWIGLGNLLQDHLGRYYEAEQAYYRALRLGGNDHPFTQANLVWLQVTLGRPFDPDQLQAHIPGLPKIGCVLIEAALTVVRGDIGTALAHLDVALGLPMVEAGGVFTFDLLRLIRLFVRDGHGERLIAWFEESGHADRSAPVHAALVAFVRGPQTLRDVNPEVRAAAARLHAGLASRLVKVIEKPEPPKRRRGRPPRRTG